MVLEVNKIYHQQRLRPCYKPFIKPQLKSLNSPGLLMRLDPNAATPKLSRKKVNWLAIGALMTKENSIVSGFVNE